MSVATPLSHGRGEGGAPSEDKGYGVRAATIARSTALIPIFNKGREGFQALRELVLLQEVVLGQPGAGAGLEQYKLG
jgi:hypothetical protein